MSYFYPGAQEIIIHMIWLTTFQRPDGREKCSRKKHSVRKNHIYSPSQNNQWPRTEELNYRQTGNFLSFETRWEITQEKANRDYLSDRFGASQVVRLRHQRAGPPPTRSAAPPAPVQSVPRVHPVWMDAREGLNEARHFFLNQLPHH